MTNDLKFTTAGEYMKDHDPPEPCYIIEGEWAKDTKEKNERTLGREIPSKNN
jgi:hypothetical protein